MLCFCIALIWGVNMRENKKHLVEVPLNRLSRLSHLVVDLRNDPEKLQKYNYWEEFAAACLAIETDGVNMGFAELCYAIADLIMEAVYSEGEENETS